MACCACLMPATKLEHLRPKLHHDRPVRHEDHLLVHAIVRLNERMNARRTLTVLAVSLAVVGATLGWWAYSWGASTYQLQLDWFLNHLGVYSATRRTVGDERGSSGVYASGRCGCCRSCRRGSSGRARAIRHAQVWAQRPTTVDRGPLNPAKPRRTAPGHAGVPRNHATPAPRCRACPFRQVPCSASDQPLFLPIVWGPLRSRATASSISCCAVSALPAPRRPAQWLHGISGRSTSGGRSPGSAHP